MISAANAKAPTRVRRRRTQAASSVGINANENLERRIDGFYAVCEKVLLRTLTFACFVYELGRFAIWLWR
jgi:hypothetical protein